MGRTLILTSCWSVEASVADVWALLTGVEDWPRWWSSAAEAEIVTRDPAQPHRWPMSWSALIGRPLRMQVSMPTAQAPDLIEWRWHGDLECRATWVLSVAEAHGSDITSRWELQLAPERHSLAGFLASWLLERRVFAMTQGLADDMGRRLGCRVSPLRQWQGSIRHPRP